MQITSPSIQWDPHKIYPAWVFDGSKVASEMRKKQTEDLDRRLEATLKRIASRTPLVSLEAIPKDIDSIWEKKCWELLI